MWSSVALSPSLKTAPGVSRKKSEPEQYVTSPAPVRSNFTLKNVTERMYSPSPGEQYTSVKCLLVPRCAASASGALGRERTAEVVSSCCVRALWMSESG